MLQALKDDAVATSHDVADKGQKPQEEANVRGPIQEAKLCKIPTESRLEEAHRSIP